MSDLIHVVCPHCAQLNRLPAQRAGDLPNCGQCGHKLLDGHPVSLDDSNFGRYIAKNDLPVVVDFWAAWCGPCKMMAPVFAQAAPAYSGRYLFAKLETDAAPLTAQRYNIRSIPTLIVFRAGNEIARQSGAMDAGSLSKFIAGLK